MESVWGIFSSIDAVAGGGCRFIHNGVNVRVFHSLILWWVLVHSTIELIWTISSVDALVQCWFTLCKGLSHHSLEAYHDSVMDEP
jgi:hypothetical protein